MPAGRDGLYQARYLLPTAFGETISGQRVAMVDDVMSAGSALRGSFTEIVRFGGRPDVAGALLVLGSRGLDFFAEKSLPVEAVARDEFALWLPPSARCAPRGLSSRMFRRAQLPRIGAGSPIPHRRAYFR